MDQHSPPSGTHPDDASKSTSQYGLFLPYLVLMLSLAATFLVWTAGNRAANRDARDYFDFRANDAVEKIENRLKLYDQALRGAQALFISSGNVSREEFREYVSSLNLDTAYPGILGIGFALGISPSMLVRHEELIRKQGFPDYAVRPAGRRDFYTSIIYLEPFDWRNKRAFGYDMYSESTRRKAMAAARDTGKMTMSGKVMLVQETGKDVQAGFLMYLPVFKAGVPPANREARRAAFLGWTYSVFRMGDFMRGVFGGRSDEYDFHVYDGDGVSEKSLMYDSHSGGAVQPRFVSIRRMQIANHEWTIRIASLPQMESRFDSAKPDWIAGGGILVSLLLFLVTWMQVNGKRRALLLAFELNRDLIESRKALQIENEKSLALLRNASDGIYILDESGNVIEASDSFCAMLGYSREEMIGMNVFSWDASYSDRSTLLENIGKQFEKTDRYQFETLHRRKNGTVFEVEVSGVPLVLDGSPVLFKSSRDITERKLFERSYREERDFSNAVLDSAGTVILVIDGSGAISRFNRAAEAFSGYAFEEVKGKPFFWRNFLLSEQRSGVEAVFKSVLDGNVGSSYENFWVNRDGEKRLFFWTNTLIRDQEGNARFLVAIGSDISERKNLEQQLTERESLFHAIFDQTPNAIELIDPETLRFVEVNPAACRMLGYTHEEFTSMKLVDTQVDLGEEALRSAVRKIELSGSVTLENRHRCKNGEILDVEITSKMLDLPGRKLLVGVWRDVTASRRAERAMRITSSVFDISQEGILITDADNVILEVNPAFSIITGYAREEVIGKKPNLLSSGRQDKSFYEDMWRALNEKDAWRGEVWNRKKSGEIYAELLSISVIRDEDGKTLRHVGVFADINDLKRHEAELSRIAHYDALTGIPNRALLADRMKQAIAQTRRDQNLMAVCYLDLDGFKTVNDTMGHEAGDEVLIGVAERIKNTIRGGDTVARLGGDEFVLLLLGLEKGEECVATLGRLLEAISVPFEIMGKSFTLGASIGVSIYPLDDEDADTLMRHADQAMYQAKQSGKNRFEVYDPSLDLRAKDHREFMKRIRQAIDDREFELYYQPKINLKTRQMVGAEALLRWRHPERGLLSPAEFLHLVENTEFDIEIGEWVVEHALVQLRQWHRAGLVIGISINISAYHIESNGFVDMLKKKLDRYPDVPASSIQIEILETVALADVAVVSGVIEACRKFGVGFALDDFGTGYSSLAYLSRLPIDALKIDQSFIRGMLNDKGDFAIVQGIVALASAFGQQTIAEGIESEAHYAILAEMGCDLGQGYGIARPMPAGELMKWRVE
jgi:diguanylate cyclase (GGDEF)-like protein/PAS domain S-box-containing protein